MADGFLVLLEDPTGLAVKTPVLAKVVAKALAVPVADAAQRMRYGGGIVARELPEPQAAKLAQALTSEGHAAQALPSAVAEALPRPRRLVSLVPQEGGLKAISRGVTREETIPWSRILGLHAYALARTLSREERDEKKARAKPDPTDQSETRQLLFDIYFWEDQERGRRIELAIDVVTDDPVAVYRLAAEDAEYREFAKKSDNTYENFVALARALAKGAPPRVVVPPTTRAFADHLDWKAVLFDKPEERDSFDAWLVLACRHGKPFGLGAPTAEADDIEDLDDSALEDSEEGLEAEDDGDVEDAPEDIEDEDEEEDADEEDDDEEEAEEDDDEDDDDDASAEPETRVRKPGSTSRTDPDIALALELVDKTRRIKKKDVLDMVAAAADIGDLQDSGEVEPGAAPAPELELFDERKTTGRLSVTELLSETESLGELEQSDDPDATPPKKG